MSIEEFVKSSEARYGLELSLVEAPDGHDYLLCRDRGYHCAALSMTHAAGCRRCKAAWPSE